MSLVPGARLGPFEIVALIGAGDKRGAEMPGRRHDDLIGRVAGKRRRQSTALDQDGTRQVGQMKPGRRRRRVKPFEACCRVLPAPP